MTRKEIEAEGFDFIDQGDGVLVVARRWVEQWGPFESDEAACAAVLAGVPALRTLNQ